MATGDNCFFCCLLNTAPCAAVVFSYAETRNSCLNCITDQTLFLNSRFYKCNISMKINNPFGKLWQNKVSSSLAHKGMRICHYFEWYVLVRLIKTAASYGDLCVTRQTVTPCTINDFVCWKKQEITNSEDEKRVKLSSNQNIGKNMIYMYINSHLFNRLVNHLFGQITMKTSVHFFYFKRF